jgi:PAS domain S-box-containing protein
VQQSFAKLFQSSHLGVVIVTPERIVDANDAFLRMTGYTHDEVLEGSIDWKKLTPPEFTKSDQKALEQLRAFGVAVPHEKAYVLRDGSRVDFVIGAVRLSEDPFMWASYT